ncbi:MAG TPA: sulfotransferase [Mucilaginibacter sp.]|jgi:hypothetical protein|nr:sulfotransferase [Mucilaginibacter sp.]
MTGRDYNFMARLVHKIALQYPGVAEMSFDIENALAKRTRHVAGNHVFITGLARSGTTTLLNYLYQTGAFKSLIYSDMPFVLMPNTWRKISLRKTSQPTHERAHADGIMIGPESPEAFEEVFWRVFCGKHYIREDRLLLHNVDTDVSKKFDAYVGNVSGNGEVADGTRYLSKNNNNILRIDYLKKTFPEALILITFRDPLQQAISLLNQHLLFSEIHRNDRFALNYMNWLGHFEFGLNQKPFFLGDEIIFKELLSCPKTSINFWLLTWKNYYQYAGKHISANALLFNYEKFCADRASSLTQLFSKINVPHPGFKPEPFNPVMKHTADADRALLAECNAIYNDLESKAGL